MSAEFFHSIKLPLSVEQYRQLPRNAAYKYELIEGETWLTPRPRWYHAVLDLWTFDTATSAEEGVALRPLAPLDWDAVPVLFAAAFRTIPPFGSLNEDARLEAARHCLERTRSGADGPLIDRACFVAETEAERPACGAILVTLVRDVDMTDPQERCLWGEPPPADAVERRLGLPHLTWIFVGPWHAGSGVGSALLARAVTELLGLGFTRLASTFLLGNDSSMLWHWRNGFRLLAHPYSGREQRRRWESSPERQARERT
jgi:hypothetical protein